MNVFSIIRRPLTLVLVFALAVFASVLTVNSGSAASGGLYAVDGASGNSSTLYELDPNTGAVVQIIGPIGFNHVVGIDVHPTTGVMYGVFNSYFYGPTSLITIDKATGAGTVIGPLGTGAIPDISFDSNGTLYAWSEGGDDLYTVDLTSGAATKVGECFCGTAGTGLAFDSADNLYMKDYWGLNSMDSTTGAITSSVGLSPSFSTHNMLEFDANDVLYTAGRGGGSVLKTIDVSTGVITDIGVTGISRLAGIAFDNASNTKESILSGSGVTGKGIDTAPGLQKEFNPKGKGAENAGKKK